MANTFKLKTKAGVNSATTAAVYTVPSSTTAVIIGLTITNVKGAAITADAKIVTASSSGENADDVFIVKVVPLPSGSTMEVMSGNKIILQTGDSIIATGSNGSGADADIILSVMEIT